MDKKKRSVSEKRDRMLGFVTAMPAMILLFVFTVPDLLFHVFRKPDLREENLRGTGQLQRTVWFRNIPDGTCKYRCLYSTVRQSDHGAGSDHCSMVKRLQT